MAFLDHRLHDYTELGKVVRRNTLVAKYEWAFGGAFSDCRGVAILLGGSLAEINQFLSLPLCISLTIVPITTALRIERRITEFSGCRLDYHTMREKES